MIESCAVALTGTGSPRQAEAAKLAAPAVENLMAGMFANKDTGELTGPALRAALKIQAAYRGRKARAAVIASAFGSIDRPDSTDSDDEDWEQVQKEATKLAAETAKRQAKARAEAEAEAAELAAREEAVAAQALEDEQARIEAERIAKEKAAEATRKLAEEQAAADAAARAEAEAEALAKWEAEREAFPPDCLWEEMSAREQVAAGFLGWESAEVRAIVCA